jgi:hypothetical protein
MLLMLSALFALAPSEPRSLHEPSERPTACEVVEIRSNPWAHGHSRFSATRILELEFETELSGRPKHERTLRLRLYTPRGFLYQVLSTPLQAPGHSRRRLEAHLPVAGTSIMASGLYGRWTVKPFLDDAREPCGQGRHFVLKP